MVLEAASLDTQVFDTVLEPKRAEIDAVLPAPSHTPDGLLGITDDAVVSGEDCSAASTCPRVQVSLLLSLTLLSCVGEASVALHIPNIDGDIEQLQQIRPGGWDPSA